MPKMKAFLTFVCAALLAVLAVGTPVALAQTSPIQSQEMNAPGFVAELIEANRSDGVLSLRIRIKNTDKTKKIFIYKTKNDNEQFYFQAENKKYFMLTDSEKAPLTAPLNSGYPWLQPEIKAGASFTWWAKYPAPPANVKKVSFYWPLSGPFDDVPIADK